MPPPNKGAALGADLVLVAITAVWGITFVVVKDALASADPLSFLAMRFSLGALLLTLLVRGALLRREELRAGAVLSVFLFLGFVTQTLGLVETPPSRSAFITGMAVVLVPFASILVFRRWPKLPSWAGVALAVAGLYALTGVGGAAKGTPRGDLLTLACAVTFAFHIVYTEKLAPGRNPVALVAVQLWIVAALSGLCLLVWPPRVTLGQDLVVGVVLTAVFASALAISLQTWAQARTTAVRAALIFSLEPVFATAWSVAVGREVLGRGELLGGALIVLGVLTAEVGNAALARRQAAAR